MLDFKDKFLCNVYGACGSGKSYLTKYLIAYMYSKKLFNFIYVITGTSFNNFYDFVPKSYVTPYSDLALTKFIKFCAKYKHIPKLLVLDDCAGTVKRNSRPFRYLINNYRHLGLYVIICSQFFSMVPPAARNNSKYDFIFMMHTESAFKASFRSNAVGFFNSNKEWAEYLKSHCKDYVCILVDRSQGEKEKRFIRFKAPSVPKFTIKQ